MSRTSAIFLDRTEAATILAEKLRFLIKNKKEARKQKEEKDIQQQQEEQELIILAIPRGGMITGDVIASTLNAKLDVMVARKVGAPYNSELAIGAVMHDGTFFPNTEIIRMLKIPQEYIDEQISIQMEEIECRIRRFKAGERKGDYYHYNLHDKTIVLVDDGIATGATIFAAIEWLRRRQNPKELIVAAPVAPRDTVDKLRRIVDKVVVLHAPILFGAVGAFYQDFSQVSDGKVVEIMSKYR
jgi:predicted phosphoribosyltransferase